MISRAALLAATTAAALLLAGCAVSPGAGSGSGGFDDVDFDPVIAAPGDVHGQGTVLEVDGSAPELCLGAIAESYPPQCSGPEILAWDWAIAEYEETANGVTWGAYAVTGTWDGERFTVTSTIPLALYDPMPIVDPLLDPSNAGASDESELTRIQDDLHDAAPFEVLSSSPQNGYLFVDVVYDDGRIQKLVDTVYGTDIVAIRPALRDA